MFSDLHFLIFLWVIPVLMLFQILWIILGIYQLFLMINLRKLVICAELWQSYCWEYLAHKLVAYHACVRVP